MAENNLPNDTSENESIIRALCSFKGKVSYNNLYVAPYVSKKTLPLAKKTNINLKRMEDFIQQDVVPAINRWKANPPTGSKTTGKDITLPDGLWFLHLIDYIL